MLSLNLNRLKCDNLCESSNLKENSIKLRTLKKLDLKINFVITIYNKISKHLKKQCHIDSIKII